jgi:hypothetical protein
MKIAFYKGTRKGVSGIYSVGVRFVTNSPYSHCEMIFSDGISASASFIDKGVRFKNIDYSNSHDWDFIDIPDRYEKYAFDWFKANNGKPYDLLGNLHFLIGFIRGNDGDWFCSEALASALGIEGAEKYDPGMLHSLLAFAFPQKMIS